MSMTAVAKTSKRGSSTVSTKNLPAAKSLSTKSGTDWLRTQVRRMSPGEAPSISEEQAAALAVERWLQRYGISYAPPAPIPMDLIDEKRSRGNQARQEAIVADSVERFSQAMKAGAVFPPIVVHQWGSKLVIVDGNNRQAAAKKTGWTHITGIVISEDTSSELIALLTAEANATHGVAPDRFWRINQALHLATIGYTDARAAAATGVSASQISMHRSANQAQDRAEELKLSGFAELPVTTRAELNRVSDDAVFYQATRLAIDHGLSLEDIKRHLKPLKALSSEAARLEYLANLARDLQAARVRVKATGKVAVRSPKTTLTGGVGMLLSVDESALLREIITTRDRDIIVEALRRAEDKLTHLQLLVDKLRNLETD